MKTYLVGGAVRDALLGRPVSERDWVVVGATPQDMRARGFRQVGKDFPVFLHPETHEEYALARTERKTAPGYHGFAFRFHPNITLEEDLRRRDLTVNAMAQGPDGGIIDPFDGRRDLEQRWLRHVSPAFAEDPVRILRLARFKARFAELGFHIAPETRALIGDMVVSGEVDALVPERVWQELRRALDTPKPSKFFEVLRDCGALARLFPEINRLFGVPQPPQHHPEVDTGLHTLMVLDQAARLNAATPSRFAALCHDLGKGTTPAEYLPRHIGHQERGVKLIEDLCRRYRIPKAYRDLAVLTARFHSKAHTVGALKPGTLLDLLGRLDSLRRAERFEEFLTACEADYRGRKGFEEREYRQADYLRAARAAVMAVDAGALARQGFKGERLAQELATLRLEKLRALKESQASEAVW